MSEARELTISLARQAGFLPGTYSSSRLPPYQQIQSVYDGLIRQIDGMVVGATALDLCETLYKRHEVVTGHMIRLKHESALDQMTVLENGPSIGAEQQWFSVAPYTETLRWLIEHCVKNASLNGRRIGGSNVERLIALAGACFEWDLMWENITRDIFSYELRIAPNFDITCHPTNLTRRAQRRFNLECIPYIQRSDEHLANSMRLPGPEFSMEKVTTLPEVQILEEPLERERGYKFSEWLRFIYGLIDSFEAPEYFKTIGSKNLSRFLYRKWGLGSQQFQRILVDHALSKETIQHLNVSDLEPVAHAHRDSRLMRRPIVRLPNPEEDLFFYGVETSSAGFQKVFEMFFSGRVQFSGMKNDGPLNKAIGRIQTRYGDEFRDYVGDRCHAQNAHVVIEKDRVGNNPIPHGRGFGPVDVFVVDRKHKRFVLAEIKDVADEGTVPSKMLSERKTFKRYSDKLRVQTEWFETRIGELKEEFGCQSDETWTVDGTIVVKSPRAWMYSHTEPLNIVHELQFLRTLKNGREFVTNPVP